MEVYYETNISEARYSTNVSLFMFSGYRISKKQREKLKKKKKNQRDQAQKEKKRKEKKKNCFLLDVIQSHFFTSSATCCG